MEQALLSFFYFFRPITYISWAPSVSDLNLLELFAILFFLILLAFYLMKALSSKGIKVSAIDLLAYAYMLWCVGAFLAYFDKSQVKDVAKFIIPFFTYIVLKNTIVDRRKYLKLLWWLIMGFAVPVVLTAILVMQHKGVYVQDYWTGIYRFTGVYMNPHDMGHNMTFLLMAIVLYVTLIKRSDDDRSRRLSRTKVVFLTILSILALYCLYKSYVRTAYLGLLVFIVVYLFYTNRKWLLIFSVVSIGAVLIVWPLIAVIFHDVVEGVEGKRSLELMASGRPYIWAHNLDIFSKMSFDRQLAGVGIGNRVHVLTSMQNNDNIWNSHNDYLEVMIQTGIIGFIIFMVLQLLLFRAILRMPRKERYVFVALLCAVSFMNFASNSYVDRFGLGQMLYMVLAYIEQRSVNSRNSKQSREEPKISLPDRHEKAIITKLA